MIVQYFILITIFLFPNRNNTSCDEIDLVSNALKLYLKKDKLKDTIFIVYTKPVKIKSNYKTKYVESIDDIPCDVKIRYAIYITFFEKNFEKIVSFRDIGIRKEDSINTVSNYGLQRYYYKVIKNKCKFIRLTYSEF